MMAPLLTLFRFNSRMMWWVRPPTGPNTLTFITQSSIWDKARIRQQIILKVSLIPRTTFRERPPTLLKRLRRWRCLRPASTKLEKKATTLTPHSLMLRLISLEWLFHLRDSTDILVSPFSWKRMVMGWLPISMPLKIQSVWTLSSLVTFKNQMGQMELIPMKTKPSLKNSKKNKVS